MFLAVLCALIVLAVACPRANSQQEPAANATPHSRYRVVFLPGTFGGPDSHFQIFGAHILNNGGAFVGWSDIDLPDPYPYNCWDGSCIVARAFEFRDGQMIDLGTLAPGVSSDTN